MSTRLDVQLFFQGRSPLVAGDKHLTVLNLARLLHGLDAGNQYKTPGLINYVQVQDALVEASATATPAAVAVADTLSIGGTALTALKQRASATLTPATAIVDTTFVLNGVTFTGVAGAAVLGTATFSIDTSDAATGISIAAQINAYGGATIAGRFRAKAAGSGVVTIFADSIGTWANGTTLVGTVTVLAASAATLTGGLAASNNKFDPTGTDIDTGNAIAAAIAASTTAAIKAVRATVAASTGVVTVSSKVAGLAGNTITFTSSNGSRLAVTGSGLLAGGSASAPTRFYF